MSDLAQETRAKSGTAPAAPAAPVVGGAAAATSLASAGGVGGGSIHALRSVFSGLSDQTNSYERIGDQKSGGKFPSWQSQNWKSQGGFGVGNRLADRPQLDAKNPGVSAPAKNATIGAPSVAQANLADIPIHSSNHNGNGAYHDSILGELPEDKRGKWGNIKYSKDGPSVDYYTGRYAAGAREQVGVREAVMATGQHGTATAGADAFALAEAGADATASLGANGIQGSANASAKAGIGVRGDADLKSNPLKLAGVDPLYAGLGTHADGFAGGRAGAGIKAGIGPLSSGVDVKLGGFAGAEGNLDVHANLGPLRYKIGATGAAGIGAEASGGISLEDRTLHFGGKLGATLGLGGAISVDGSLDLRQTAQLGLAGIKQLTPENQAKRLSGALTGGAELASKGWGGVKEFLDPEHTDHFSRHGLGVRQQRIGEGISHAAQDARVWADGQADEAGLALRNAERWAAKKAQGAERWAGGKLADAQAWAGDKLYDAGQAARFALAHPGQTLSNAKGWADGKLEDAKGWAGDKLHDAGHALGSAKGWAGDKLHDAGHALGSAKGWADGKLHDAGQALSSAKSWAGSKLHDADYAVTHPGEILHNAEGWADDKLHDAGRALHGAKEWGSNKVRDAAGWAGAKLHDASETAKYAATHRSELLDSAKDWTDDKLAAAGHGLSRAKDAAAKGTSTLYDGVTDNFKKAGSTLTSGASTAWGTAKTTGKDIAHFFGL